MVGQQHFATASLYVGDLLPEVNETTLYDIFSTIGPVASVRVCRESGTRRSLGYAYVNYHTIGHAERCLETLNYTSIKGVPMRIMWSHRDPALRRSGSGNIFIKNLDKVIDTKALHDTFSLFGNILSCKVATDEYGKSRGYGFIHYDSEEAAQLAIERLDGMTIGSKKVYVGPFKKHAERPSNKTYIFTNLYVKHFPEEWGQDVLQNVFAQYGEIKSMVMTSDHKGRKFALVNFTSPTSAQNAVDDLHGRKTCATGVLPWDITSNHEVKPSEVSSENEKTASAVDDNKLTVNATESAKAKTEDTELIITDDADEEKNASTLSDEQKDKKTDLSGEETKSKIVTDNNNVSSEKENLENSTTSAVENTGDTTGSPAKREKAETLKDRFDTEGQEQKRMYSANDSIPEECLYVQRAMTKIERVAMLKESFNTPSPKESKTTNSVNGISGGSGVLSNAVNLYVKNLSERVTDEILRETFAPYGTITSAKIMKDDRNVSKGFGFVCFAFPEEATKAVTAMHLKLFFGKPLYVGLAEKRHHRTARLQQRYRINGAHRTVQNPSNITQSPMLMMGQPQVAAAATAQVPGNLMQFSSVHPPQAAAAYYSDRQMGPPQTYVAAASAINNLRRPATATQPTGYPYVFGRSNDPANKHMRRTSASAANNQNFKFTAQARNRQEYIQPPPPQATNPGYVDGMPLSALSEQQPNPQKQMLGERLFPLVHKLQPELAAKITGMMLEMDNSEVIALLESEALLCAKVEEALGVLMRHQQNTVALATPTPGTTLLPQQ